LELLVELVLLVLDVLLLAELALVEPLEVLLALVPVLPEEVAPLLVDDVEVVVPLEPEEPVPPIKEACCCISLLTAFPSAKTATVMPPPITASSNAYSTADAPRQSFKNAMTPVMHVMLHR
jgi:hypothetical protein